MFQFGCDIRRNGLRGVGLGATLLSVLACHPQTVVVPTPAQDKPPVVCVGTIVPGANGEVDQPSVCSSPTNTAPTIVYGTLGSQLLITANAVNSAGGVKSLALTVNQNGAAVYQAQTSASPNQTNQVPTSLMILGGDGHGGAGGQAFNVVLAATTSVVASAENFNGMKTLFQVNYVSLQPVSANITASPQTIAQGGTTTLKWWAPEAVHATLSPWPGTPGFQAGTSGIMPGVSPKTTTTYTLTVTQPFVGPNATFVNPPWVPAPQQPPGGTTTHPITATATATVTVQQNPCDAIGSQRQTVTLTQVAPAGGGPVGYGADFPPALPWSCVSNLNALTNANTAFGASFSIELIKLYSKHTTAECFTSPTAYVVLAPGQSTTASDLAAIYGSTSPQFNPASPIGIVACVEGGALPPVVQVTVSYTNH